MTNQNRIHSLTGLKGIFILFIVLTHTLPNTPLIQAIPFSSFIAKYGGHLGNSMFFMLSGYLIALAYKSRIRSKSVAFGDYLLRRLHKLYPMYILSNLAMLFFQILEYGPSALTLEKLAFTVLLQSGGGLGYHVPYNASTWFLSALFVCYIVYYFFAYHAKNSTQYYCMIVFGVIWGYTLIKHCSTIPFCYEGNGRAFLNFFIGCLLSEIYPNLRQNMRKWLHPAGFLILAGSFYMFMRYGVEIIAGSMQTALAFVISPLVLLLASGNGIIAKILEWKPVVYLGNISISIYFWHMVVHSLFCWIFQLPSQFNILSDALYAPYLVAMFVFSIVVFHLFRKKNLV